MFLTLIVEDNATFRQSLRELLRIRFPSMGIEEAEDGMEALRKVGDFLPDLVFMDIKLPGANGLELTKRIRDDYQKMVIVVLTSYDLPEYREAALKSGANFFLTKGSTTSEEIIALVELVSSNGNHEIRSSVIL